MGYLRGNLFLKDRAMDMQAMIANLSTTGRNEEIGKIKTYIENLQKGQGGTLLIRSEMDFGQNLMVRAILSQSQTSYHVGVCQPFPYFSPYDTLKQCFPDFFEHFRDKTIENFSFSLSALNKNLYKGNIGRVTRKMTRKETTALLPLTSEYIIGIELSEYLAHQEKPTIIFIQDIHWADISTLKILKFLTLTLKEKPVFFIFTACPDILDTPELPPELRGENVPVIAKIKAMQLGTRPKISGEDQRQLFYKLQSESETDIMDFPPIEEKLLLSFLNKILDAKMSKEFKNYLMYLTGGNIYFLSQIFLYLSENLLVRGNKRWQLKYPEEEISLPEYIEGVLEVNNEKLTHGAFQTLECAAIFGASIPINLLKGVMNFEEQRWEEVLENLIERGLFQQCFDSLVFCSEKQRQIIANNLTTQDREAINGKWALFLAKLDYNPDRCVYHIKKSEDSGAALEYFLKAGLDAEYILAYVEAYEYYREAAKSFPESWEIFDEACRELLTLLKEQEDSDEGESIENEEEDIKESKYKKC